MVLRQLSILTLLATVNSLYTSDSNTITLTIKVVSNHKKPELYTILPFDIQVPVETKDTNGNLLGKLKTIFHTDAVSLYVNDKNCDAYTEICDAKISDGQDLLATVKFNYPKIFKQLKDRELTGKKINGLRDSRYDLRKYLKYMQEKNKQ